MCQTPLWRGGERYCWRTGSILTDDISDLPRPAFLQLSEEVRLESQSSHAEEKLLHVFPYHWKNTRLRYVQSLLLKEPKVVSRVVHWIDPGKNVNMDSDCPLCVRCINA